MAINNTAVKGTTLSVGGNAVAQITKIDGPGMKVGKRDITALSSAAKEYAPSIGDPQEFGGSLVWYSKDVGLTTMQSRCNTPTSSLDTIVVTMADSKTFSVSGFVTSLDPKGGDVEGTWMADFTFQPSGAITYPTTT